MIFFACGLLWWLKAPWQLWALLAASRGIDYLLERWTERRVRVTTLEAPCADPRQPSP